MNHCGADILPSPDADELVDFTCASPWERLALDIELELRSWGLHDGQLPRVMERQAGGSGSAEHEGTSTLHPRPVVCSTLSFEGKSLSLELRSSPPLHSLDAPPLERLLGVSQCVLLAADAPDEIVADDGSDAAMLLSAMAVAASACACAVPMVVPVGRPSSLRFIGRQMHPKLVRFSCDFTHQISDDQTHLAGLLHLFQNKRTAAKRLYPPPMSDAQITAKFVYDWIDFSFKLTPTPGSFASDRRLSAVQSLAMGEADPIRKIRVTAMWDEFAASSLKQNPILTGMPASTAARLRLALSSDLLEDIASSQIPSARLPLTSPGFSNLRLSQTASNLRTRDNPAAPLAVIDVRKSMLSPVPASSSETSPRASHSTHIDAPESPRLARVPAASALDDYLIQVGEYVAAAAIQDDRIDEQFLTSAVAALFEMNLGRGIMADVVDALGPNAAESTVLERLARLTAASETVNSAQKLWNLFLDGVEVHWQQDWIICGVPFSAGNGPDHDESLVTQKLQMINCCVERRLREANAYTASGRGLKDDGYGRKAKIDGVKLVDPETSTEARCDEERAVWEPVVQPHALSTRDMVDDELQRMVLRAEASGGSPEVESKRQSLTLKSDMMAFKAANPKASMADFVRWFSPADWVCEEDDQLQAKAGEDEHGSERAKDTFEGKPMQQGFSTMHSDHTITSPSVSSPESGNRRRGRLSTRMSRAGNVWEELWKEAEGLPAAQQAPLFDASAHGSKALADLRAMPMSQVLVHLAAIQGSSAASLLHNAFSRPPNLPTVRLRLANARHSIRRTSASLALSHADAAELGRVAAALDIIAAAEHTALIATSVFTKLPPVDGLGHVVDQLACGDLADVSHERERALITRMAGLDDAGWRNVLLPEFREFVLCGEGGDRMYARLGREEFRVAFRLGLIYSA